METVNNIPFLLVHFTYFILYQLAQRRPEQGGATSVERGFEGTGIIGCESYFGSIDTLEDALLLAVACTSGLLPRVTTRLNERQRAAIRPGSVFVFCQEESGIRRWTDGKYWSPSRIFGSFLVYKEVDRKFSHSFTADTKFSPITPPPEPSSTDGGESVGDVDHNAIDFDSKFALAANDSLSSENVNSSAGAFKKGGLMKKTISVNFPNETVHIVAYCRHLTSYSINDTDCIPPSRHSFLSKLAIPSDLLQYQSPHYRQRHKDRGGAGPGIGTINARKFDLSDVKHCHDLSISATVSSLPSSPLDDQAIMEEVASILLFHKYNLQQHPQHVGSTSI